MNGGMQDWLCEISDFVVVVVQNRFIFAMFCSVFIYLFVEHMISISPPIWRIRFFGKQNVSKNRLHTCFDKKKTLNNFSQQNLVEQNVLPESSERLLMLPRTDRAHSR